MLGSLEFCLVAVSLGVSALDGMSRAPARAEASLQERWQYIQHGKADLVRL
jgi:hypothetical protein